MGEAKSPKLVIITMPAGTWLLDSASASLTTSAFHIQVVLDSLVQMFDFQPLSLKCFVDATHKRQYTGSYRILIAVQFLWALILSGGLFALPESLRYFVKTGKLEPSVLAQLM
jgi:hypothetical protein